MKAIQYMAIIGLLLVAGCQALSCADIKFCQSKNMTANEDQTANTIYCNLPPGGNECDCLDKGMNYYPYGKQCSAPRGCMGCETKCRK